MRPGREHPRKRDYRNLADIQCGKSGRLAPYLCVLGTENKVAWRGVTPYTLPAGGPETVGYLPTRQG
jgi:hypothetical protein